jgi:hypothetical protein
MRPFSFLGRRLEGGVGLQATIRVRFDVQCQRLRNPHLALLLNANLGHCLGLIGALPRLLQSLLRGRVPSRGMRWSLIFGCAAGGR